MRRVSESRRRVLSAAGLTAVAVGSWFVLRFGVRGRLPVRVLSRVLNLSARQRRAARLSSSTHARIYRASRGRLLCRWFGARVLVIETRGRRSGRIRQTAVIYVSDGDRYVVTPANAGVDRIPQWWLNLHAAGRGVVLVDGRRQPVVATEATGAERDRLARLLVEVAPAMSEYECFTQRHFPVVILEPAG